MSDDDFSEFFVEAEPRIRRALVAAYGPERGLEAAAEALAYAWQEWDAVRVMANPVGYLYRVGQSKSRPRRRAQVFPTSARDGESWFEPGLPEALNGLTERERTAVVLIEGYGWTYREVADTTGVARSTVQVQFERGLAKLRSSLGVEAREVGHE